MRRDGWLLSQRQGRGVSYAPSERTLAGHRRRATTFTPEGPPWGGAFHALLVSVPETERAFRDEFRRAAHIAGYRILRAGLLVAPSDRRDEIGDLLERVPLDASVLPAWLELAPEDARREASQLWKLDDLEKRYRRLAEHARTAAAVVTSSPTTSEDGILRPFAEVTLPIYRAIADDPGLPADLLPRDWPARELGSALGEALRAFGPAVASHIERRRRNSPG
jgi:phenylacetic acid degradation operon negative regulatory protein